MVELLNETSMEDEGILSNVASDLFKALRKDLRTIGTRLSREEIRLVIDTYYDLQQYRIAAAGRQRSLSDDDRTTVLQGWLTDQMLMSEKAIAYVMDKFTDADPMGQWSKRWLGVGPVLSAAFSAYIDITKAPTVGHIWRFAGLDPSVEWKRGEKRPWNAQLKVTCWKLGESFVKVSKSTKPEGYYGRLYAERKAQEVARNDAGEFAEQARRVLGMKKIRDPETRACYESGKLPKGHVNARAKRWTVKIFLAHWHAEAYRQHYGVEPPKPYPIAILGHAHDMRPPVI